MLDKFLGDAQFSSHGKFSVSVKEMLLKLGRHSLHHPHNWLLLLIRTYVKAGSDSIWIHQQGSEVWLLAHNPSRFPELEAAGELDEWPRCLAALIANHPQRVVCCQWLAPGAAGEARDVLGNPEPLAPTSNPPLSERGPTFALYLQLASVPNFREHLAYAVQFCPIPVILHKPVDLLGVTLYRQNEDLRGRHWLSSSAESAAYPPGWQLRLALPVLCDFYQPNAEAPAILLKPPGGDRHGQNAAWTYQPEYLWHDPPSFAAAVSSFARYYLPVGTARIQQTLEWSARRTYFDSSWGEKGTSQASQVFDLGERLVVVQDEKEVDWILPVRHGICLAPLRGLLQIPGVALVVAAEELEVDLSLMTVRPVSAWIQLQRERISECLEVVTEHPPEAGIAPPSQLRNTMLATGGVALACSFLDGVQPWDLLALTHGGIFGGALVFVAGRVWRRLFPGKSQAASQQKLRSLLARRLELARSACAQHKVSPPAS